jgi:hypothetical protein
VRSAEAEQRPDGFRAIAQNTVPQVPGPQPDAVLSRLIQLLQNTNFTAAEPAFNRPHYYSTPIDISARYTVPAAAGSYVAAISYTVTDGRAARISAYGFNVRDPLYTYNGDILFQVCKNGMPVPGLQNIAEQRGTLVLPAETFIIGAAVYHDSFQFMVRRAVAGVAVDVDLLLRGWTWRPLREKEGPAIGIPQ